MDVTIREIQKQEYPLLDNFLYEAIFIPEGVEPPQKPLLVIAKSFASDNFHFLILQIIFYSPFFNGILISGFTKTKKFFFLLKQIP